MWNSRSATRRRSAAQPGQAGSWDVVYACNVYHLMGPDARRAFAAALAALARPGGLLFLSTLSPRDPQHYAVGEPVPGEERSWVEHVYLHFCTAEELAADFGAFEVLDLEERSYRGAQRQRRRAPARELVPRGAPPGLTERACASGLFARPAYLTIL